jgi:hypothetical protein
VDARAVGELVEGEAFMGPKFLAVRGGNAKKFHAADPEKIIRAR